MSSQQSRYAAGIHRIVNNRVHISDAKTLRKCTLLPVGGSVSATCIADLPTFLGRKGRATHAGGPFRFPSIAWLDTTTRLGGGLHREPNGEGCDGDRDVNQTSADAKRRLGRKWRVKDLEG